MQEIPAKIADLMGRYRIREAQAEAMNFARLGNKYLAETEPWKLAKTDPERVKTIMNMALQITANLSIILQPFLSKTARSLSQFLDFNSDQWTDAGRIDLLSAGHQINQPEILFTKIDDAFVETEVEILKNANPVEETNVAPQKPEITFDDFAKLDIRTATILEAERVPKADKLLKLLVDTGVDKRTILSGIAEHYAPEDIIGQRVIVLINLAPRKIRGIESQGMILMAGTDEKLSFVQGIEDLGNGVEVR
jgi:methionyl-tRNA synthetase